MSTSDSIILGAIAILVLATLIWVYVRRRRLFSNVHFAAETTFRYFQTADKQQAIDAVQYQREEKEEDDAGDPQAGVDRAGDRKGGADG